MKYKLIIETDAENPPKDHELSAAVILASHFKADVTILRPEKDKTPDMSINGVRWEIKSPKGDGKKTVENNLRTARKQSVNVALDLRRAKLHQTKAISRINEFLSKGHRLKRLIIITKSKKIIEIL